MISTIPTVHGLAACNPQGFISGKKTAFAGIGPDSLIKFHERAKLLTTVDATPYLKQTVMLPVAAKEVYFDIEADPMRDVVYLHGFVEREHGQPATARFIPFFADGIDPAHEEAVFRDAWAYLAARTQDSVIYYYSKYERTAYRKLAGKYPAVCNEDQVNDLFGLPIMVDLYFDVVKPATEWPTYDQSIKTLAQHLGFQWRDVNPSGAASIEWYHRWIETGDPSVRQRILDYNEDDCLATGVVVDGIRNL
jgi:predicted RecB family nuclease